MRRRHLLTTVAGAAAASVLAACGRDDQTTGALVGGAQTPIFVYPAGQRPTGPALAGTLLDGAAFDTATVAGNVVVVNFWGSWCAPCRAETDDLEAVYQATRDAGVSFLGINVRDGKDAASAFVRGRVGYPSIFDPGGRMSLEFRDVPASAIPSTVLLDRQNRIAVVFRRAVVRSELEPLVTQLAAERA